jgi:hypothetical protein
MRAGAIAVGAGFTVACLVGGATWLVLASGAAPDTADRSSVSSPPAAAPRAVHDTDAAAAPSDRPRRRVTSAPPRPKKDPSFARLRELRTLAETEPTAALRQLVAALAQDPELGEKPAWQELRTQLETKLAGRVLDAAGSVPQTAAEEARKLLPLIADPSLVRQLRLVAADGVEGAAALSQRERETVGRAESTEDAEVLSRHLGVFGSGAHVDETSELGARIAAVRRRNASRKVRMRVLAVRDVEAVETRRLEQLDKLRQREALGLLDHIHAGLAWLALHQAEDGHFSDAAAAERCAELGHATSCVKKRAGNELAGTALATLAFLDFRDQDTAGHFEPTLSRAVSWLRAQIKANGSFKQPGYPAGIALMALGQAASSSGDAELTGELERLWTFYAGAAGSQGGYRYKLHQAGDLSVTGWYAQAYEAARDAEIRTVEPVGPQLDRFVTAMWAGGHKFGYTQEGWSRTLESVGMLSLLILRDELDENLRADWAVRLAAADRGDRINLYTLYYDVRTELALNGSLSDHRRQSVFELAEWYQQPDGDAAGRFTAELDRKRLKATPTDEHPRMQGKERWFRKTGGAVTTAFCVLILEHALYRR